MKESEITELISIGDEAIQTLGGYVKHFRARDGALIRYGIFENPRAVNSVVLLTGWSETFYKYTEVIADLLERGLSVYTLDHRSQGFSTRLGNHPLVTHVDDFWDYVSDLEIFMDQMVPRREGGNIYLLAHSMGGMIASLYTLRHPDVFRAMILCAPMFEFSTGFVPPPIAYTLACGAVAAGRSKFAVFENFGEKFSTFESNICTHSPARFRMGTRIMERHPESVIRVISFGWVKAAFVVCRYLRANAEKIKTPILLLQAGKDMIVTARAQKEFARRAPHCTLRTLTSAYHEILMERDDIRDDAFHSIDFFLAKYGHVKPKF